KPGSRCRIARRRSAIRAEFAAGPQEAVGQELTKLRRRAGLHIVTQRGAEDPALTELAGPADDMLTTIHGTLDSQQLVGLRVYGNSLVKLISGGFPVLRQELRDRAALIHLAYREGPVRVMDLGAQAAEGFPLFDLGWVAEGMDRAMHHDGRFAVASRLHGVI